MSEKLKQAEAKYQELCEVTEVLIATMRDFRKLYQPDSVDFREIQETLYHMMMEIDDQLLEENLE